ncbi:Nn.00g046390.m01.CDS01 [Neocucurbitaria sp. VM-36]
MPEEDTQQPTQSIVNTTQAPTEGSPATVSTELNSDPGASLAPTSTRSSAITSSATSASPPSTDDAIPLQGGAVLQYPCPGCHLQFRTQGLRRNHFNRKHNRRYACSLCTAAFELQADLKRHQHTVHKELYHAETLFFCPNFGCATPEREFNRKDNYLRHVERCRHTIAKGKGLALTVE